jgi:hypothetical protein
VSLPVPSNPHQFWSALELHDGSAPVWPSYQDGDNERHNSHVGFMHANNIHPDQVKGYWHWDPREGRWNDLTGYTDMYQNLYDDPEAKKGDWYFGKTAYAMEQADSKWAWIEGQPPEFWVDSEHGLESADEADEMLRGKGFNTRQIDHMWDQGSVDDHLIVAHFEKLVQMALRNPKLQPILQHLEGESYKQINESSVVAALNAAGVKWAIGLIGEADEGFGLEIGAKGSTTTIQDIEKATNRRVLPISWKDDNTGEDAYGLGQQWNFGPQEGTFSKQAGPMDWWNRLERGPQQPVQTPQQMAQGKMCYFHPNLPAVAAEGFAPMCADCYARYQQQMGRQANRDDPYYDPEFPTHDELDAEDDKWWDSVKPGSHQINSLDELHPWRPGTVGKGLIERNGKILTWDNLGIHHQEVAQLLPRGPKDVHTYLDTIEPDGTVGMTDYDPALERPLAAVGLKPMPLNEWSF